jgi:hypothetical protein
MSNAKGIDRVVALPTGQGERSVAGMDGAMECRWEDPGLRRAVTRIVTLRSISAIRFDLAMDYV